MLSHTVSVPITFLLARILRPCVILPESTYSYEGVTHQNENFLDTNLVAATWSDSVSDMLFKRHLLWKVSLIWITQCSPPIPQSVPQSIADWLCHGSAAGIVAVKSDNQNVVVFADQQPHGGILTTPLTTYSAPQGPL